MFQNTCFKRILFKQIKKVFSTLFIYQIEIFQFRLSFPILKFISFELKGKKFIIFAELDFFKLIEKIFLFFLVKKFVIIILLFESSDSAIHTTYIL